ncbi:hypothetical protein [Paenibacillus oleatilyticus]|uniref:hypothetical protein n=1 Tax=Paenibacillus oleatilyticus TaxID=2594886 RepID=UPI001C1F60BB|nr:hypothetical protein [Paenibacillus oleatilyticus]MBU7320875.1 hypothetical protein [Paenibacillus oleatilyticus]
MKSLNMLTKPSRTAWLGALAISAVCLSASPPAVYAGKPGVFVANDTYFTLENASLAAGGDSPLMQFSLKLHNGGTGAVDFNGYGVRVVDEAGNRYPARLGSKQSARVQPGKEQTFDFYSQLAPGIKAEGLKVDLYAWDGSGADQTRDIGALPVADSLPGGVSTASQTLLRLKDADPAAKEDVFLTFVQGDGFRVVENGKPYLYVNLYVTGSGKTDATLPSGLQYRLLTSDGRTLAAALSGSDNSSLLPNETVQRTVKAELSEQSVGPLTLQLVTSNAGEDKVLGSLPLGELPPAVKLGSEKPLARYGTGSGLTVVAEKATAIRQEDGMLLQSSVTLRNDSDRMIAVPALTGAYQFGKDGSAAASEARSSRDAYLAPKAAVSFSYTALLPSGVEPDAAQLVVRVKEDAAGTSAGSGTTASASGGSASSGANTANSGAAGSAASAGTSASGSTSGTAAGGSASGSSSAGGSSGGTNAASGTSGQTKTGTSGSGTSSSSSGTASGSKTDGRPVMVVSLQGAAQQYNPTMAAKSYEYGTPLPLAASSLIDSKLDMSLVELHLHENTDYGYKTAIAKVKYTNRGSSVLTLPDVGTELLNSQGLAFPGVRQTSAVSAIMPGTSYVVAYSFMVPADEKGDNIAFRVTDPKAIAPAKLDLGTFRVAAQREEEYGKISFYPFDVNIDANNLATTYSTSTGYSYHLNLSLTIEQREPVIIDQNFSKMEFELVDGLGRVLGSQSAGFTGTQKLITGTQRISFTNVKTEQIESGVTIRVYETIDTPNGPAKRMVREFQP